MFHLFKTFLEPGILVSVMSKFWEDTSGCTNKYNFSLAIYLMTLSSSSYGIIMDCAIIAPVYGNNVIDGLNAMENII